MPQIFWEVTYLGRKKTFGRFANILSILPRFENGKFAEISS